MLLVNYINDLDEDVTSSKYNEAIKNLIDSETQWNTKLNDDQICKILVELSKSSNRNLICIDEILKLFIKYNNLCSSANYSNVLRQWAELLCEIGKRDDALEKCREYIYHTFKGDLITNDVVLYSFRGTNEYVIKDIVNKTLSFQQPSKFNDPLDTLLFKWLEFKIKSCGKDEKIKEIYYLIRRASEHLRVRCFVKPRIVDEKKDLLEIERIHPLMWAHYAESHRGICIQYRFLKAFFHQDASSKSFRRYQEEFYTDEITTLDDKINISKALFTKDKVWEYEDEVRILDLDFSKKDNVKVQECGKNAIIEAIYLGYYCCDDMKEKVQNAIRNTTIKLYQMVIDDDNLHQLRAKRIS